MTGDKDGRGDRVVIRNETRGTTLAECAGVADTAWTRLVGLLSRSSLARGEGLLITPCSSIHMFFMRFPIDAVYLNRACRVVGLDAELRPWQVGRFYRGTRHVIELPVGTIAASGTEVGDSVAVEGYPL